MFHGPMAPPALKIGAISDVVAAPDEDIAPIKVPVGGDVAYVGQITYAITSDSELVPASGLKFNEKTRTLLVTPASGKMGTTKITILAKASGGQEAKSSFRLTVKEPEVAEGPLKDDISKAVLLVKIVIDSDGKAAVLVNDAATNSKYEVDLSPTRVKVMKYFIARGQRKKDPDYLDTTELAISDPSASTNRRFKVIAVTHDALILQDLKPADNKKPAEKAPPAPAGKGGKGVGRGKGDPKEPLGKGKSDPLSGVAGLAGSAVRVSTHDLPPVPTLLRWSAGKSLAALKEVPQDQARKILDLVAKSGPVIPIVPSVLEPATVVGSAAAGLTEEAPMPRGAAE
jgi:hypothetical protein